MKTGSVNNTFARLIERVERSLIVQAIRNSLVSIVPVLTIGALALILQTFPVAAYQSFLLTPVGGFLLKIFSLVYSATFGVLSVYMTYAVTRAYMKLRSENNIVVVGAVLASFLAFFILSGSYLDGFGTAHMGPKSMFLAMISGLAATHFYIKLNTYFLNKRLLLSSGADSNINEMISSMFPILIIALGTALINTVIIYVFGVDSFRSLLAQFFDSLFSFGANGFIKGFFFVLLSSLLWFFGIHGSDTLEGVMQTYFTPGLEANQAAVAAGQQATVILTKQFFDCFVLMGGCGAAICLLISILLFSRNRAQRSLGYAATFPMIFNINELMVFGLPIVFNPIMFVPFIAVPLICYTIAYAAFTLGLVPIITNNIEWTTPIIIGGYYATGSAAGAVLQLINVAVGVAVYTPFVRLLNRQSNTEAKNQYYSFIDYYIRNEQELEGEKVIKLNNVHGEFARGLCADIKKDYKKYIRMAYQPQYSYEDKLIGVESLMRYEHPVFGVLYPPLVIKLAEEAGFLEELEEFIYLKVINEVDLINLNFGSGIKISINVTGTTVVNPDYLEFIKKLYSEYDLESMNLSMEITEKAAIAFDAKTLDILKQFKAMGFKLAIDDFSMGQTSIKYLQDELFDIIKLDGTLVKGMMIHENGKEIIRSICKLASNIDMDIIAEYVENKEEKEMLHELGCDIYQGYMYSPAVFLKKPKDTSTTPPMSI